MRSVVQFTSRLVLVSLVAALAAACSRGSSDPAGPQTGLKASPNWSDRNTGHGLGRNGVERGPISGSSQPFGAPNSSADTVYFHSDSSDLTPEGRATLSSQLAWLRNNSTRRLTIEGHADERGTREYNIALGARRAETVRSYFASQGMNPNLVRTVSYGKERPVATCDDI